VRGSGVASGYWSDQQLNLCPAKKDDGTGDMGELDAEGNLYSRPQEDVIVTSAGMNVYPTIWKRVTPPTGSEGLRCRGIAAKWKCRALRSSDLRDTNTDTKQCSDKPTKPCRISAHAPLDGMAGRRFPSHLNPKPRRNLIQQAAIAQQDQQSGVPNQPACWEI